MNNNGFRISKNSGNKLRIQKVSKQSLLKHICPCCGVEVMAKKEVSIICGTCSIPFER